MDDRGGDRPKDGGGERRGPPDTAWLDLEMSKVLEGVAENLVRRAGEEILLYYIKQRLMERIGPRLQALGTSVADRLADDIEANLDIEARIAARREARKATDGRIADALRGVGAPPEGSGGPGPREA